MTAREFILGRFKLGSAITKGGVSPNLIFGVASAGFSRVELERALKELQSEGVLAYTGGLWWRRRTDVHA